MPVSPALVRRDLDLFRLQFIETGRYPTTRGTFRDGVDLASRVTRYWRGLEHGRLPFSVVTALEALPEWRWSPTLSSHELRFWRDVAWLQEHVLRRGGRAVLAREGPDPDFVHRLSEYRRELSDEQLSVVAARALQRVLGPASGLYYRLADTSGSNAESTKDRTRFFNRAMTAARAFFAEHGHADIPSDFVNDAGARVGVAFQRLLRLYRSRRLLSAELKLVETIPGVARLAARADRHGQLRELRAFVREHGHANVPAWHELAGLVAELRRANDAGHLSATLSRRLEALPGWTWRNTVRVGAAPAVRYDPASVSSATPRVQAIPNADFPLAVGQEA